MPAVVQADDPGDERTIALELREHGGSAQQQRLFDARFEGNRCERRTYATRW
jgi:hypothetical protein